MKISNYLVVVTSILLSIFGISGCASSPKSQCKANSDCDSGYLCNSSGACLAGNHIKITTTEVSTAIIGSSYSDQIEYEGGLAPLTWTIDKSSSSVNLDWLTIDSASGMLINIQGPPEKFPSILSASSFKVMVTDSSDNGKGVTTEQPYTMLIRYCTEDSPSFQPGSGKCMEGTLKCNADGTLGSFEATGPSTNPNHCGVNSGQCSNCTLSTADTCADGQNCLCGSIFGGCTDTNSHCCAGSCTTADDVNNCGGCGIKCNSGQSCCGGKCADKLTDDTNCGDCGNICNGQHSSGATCNNGGCDYTNATCETGWKNCGSVEVNENGCETDITKPESCGSCYIHCSPNFGCCNFNCVDLTTNNNCGWCDINCEAKNEACFHYAESFYCSCINNSCQDTTRCIQGYGWSRCYCYEYNNNQFPCKIGDKCCENNGEYKCCPGGDCNSVSCYN